MSDKTKSMYYDQKNVKIENAKDTNKKVFVIDRT